MNLRPMSCSEMPAIAWIAAGVCFLVVGIHQPAFIGLGAAYIALGLRQKRRGSRQ